MVYLKNIVVAAILLAGTLAPVADFHVSAVNISAANPPVSVTVNGETYLPEAPPFVHNGTTYYPVRELGELLGTVVFWHASSNFVTMTYPKLTVRLPNGALEATVNGQPKSLTAPLKTVDGRMYAPLRFFSEVIGAQVQWDSSSRSVSIQQANDYLLTSGMNETLWLNREEGDLYIARPYEQSPVHAGKIMADFKGDVTLESGGIRPTPSVITFVDNHGSAHEYFDTYSVLVHNQKIIEQKNASYYKRYEPNLTSDQYYHPNGWIQQAVITDGKIVSVYDEEGRLTASHDLPALVGKDEVYSVHSVMKDYLIVRPNQSGFLTYVNLLDHSVIELYEQVLTGSDLEYVKNRVEPYRGDDLRYIGYESWEDTNPLIFIYKSPFAAEYINYMRVTYDRLQ